MANVLDNFRSKYPEYSDIPDLELATKLASKYPEYSDVLDEVKSPPSAETGKSLIGNIASFEKEHVLIPAAHFANQFLLNAPRAVLNKFGVEYPEAEGFSGQMHSKAAGVAGAMLNPLSAVKALRAMGAGTGLVSKAIQGAKAGAIQGAAYTPTEDIVGIPQRVAQGVLGGAVGAVATGASEGTQEAVKFFRRLKVPAKVSNLEKISQMRQDVIKSSTTKIGTAKKDLSKALADNKANIEIERATTKALNNEANKVITDNIELLKGQFKEATETGAIDIQKRLPDFFRANGDTYGQRLDRASEGIGDKFTRGTANKILQDTVGELDDALIQSGKGRKIVDALNEKYSLVKLDKDGNVLESFDEGTPINFKEFKKDVSSVWKAISAQAKSGQKFSEEDIAASLLQKNFGEYVASEVPEFVELQSTYRPVIQAMKEAGKFFKPYAGDFTNIRGSKLLERVATGKSSPQEEKLMQFLAEGSEYAKGIGDLTGEAKTLALRISSAERSMQKGLNTPKLQSLLQEQEAIKSKFNDFINGIEKLKKPRLEQLTTRARKVKVLEANKAKAQMIKKWILGTGAVVGALTGAGQVGTALMRERMTAPR